MKIGIDARLWGESGVGRYIRNLVEHLQKLDKQREYVLFVQSKDYDNVRNKVQGPKWKIVKADIRWHTVEEQFKLPKILHKENLDLVHFPYFSVPTFYNGAFVVTIHDLILHHYPTGEASTLALPFYQTKLLGYRFVIKQAAKKAQKIIAVSNATKEEIIDHLDVTAEKIAVTYEGVDEELNENQKAAKTRFNNYFLYVGNAYPHKNLERLLDAVAMIKDKGLMMNMIFVGKEDYFYKRLKEKVKRQDLEKSVTFYGEATDRELQALYKNAKATVVPALMEGFSLPTLEAMANNCLVVASDIPSIREVCGGAAIYFNPQDSKDMVKKMEEICFNDLNHFSKNIEQGLQRSKQFSWEKMAKETLSVYESSVSLRQN